MGLPSVPSETLVRCFTRWRSALPADLQSKVHLCGKDGGMDVTRVAVWFRSWSPVLMSGAPFEACRLLRSIQCVSMHARGLVWRARNSDRNGFYPVPRERAQVSGFEADFDLSG